MFCKCSVVESALPLLKPTSPAGSSSVATTQHWQSGPQRGGWLEAAWPFASLNLPGPYIPLDTSSLSRGAVAAGPQLPSSPQSKFNLNLLRDFKFKPYWQVDPNYFEFQSAVTNFEVEVLKMQRF